MIIEEEQPISPSSNSETLFETESSSVFSKSQNMEDQNPHQGNPHPEPLHH